MPSKRWMFSGGCLFTFAAIIYVSGFVPRSYIYLVTRTRQGLHSLVAYDGLASQPDDKSSARGTPPSSLDTPAETSASTPGQAKSPQAVTSGWKVLDDDRLKHQQRREMEEYGHRAMDLKTMQPASLAPIKYMANYKNPCWYTEDEQLCCLPYFFLAGVGKCGTTNLFHVLQKHPQILPANFKEIFFWEHKLKGDFDHYIKSYSNAINRIARTVINSTQSLRHPLVTFDSTPGTYFHSIRDWESRQDNITRGPDITTADDIRTVIPGAKIIVIIRDPTIRLYSDYNHFIHKSAEDFHERVELSIDKWKECVHTMSERYCAYTLQRAAMPTALTHGLYDVFAVDWLKVFPRNQLNFIKLEEYQRNETDSLSKIIQFLDLEPMLWKIDPKEPIANTRKYKIGDMLNSTAHLLDEFYKPHRQRLADLLGDKKWLWE